MELLNNQVTREQGIHSPRSGNPSFALYLMAENISVPATVLDFPSWEEFTKEIDSGAYTHVGISFISPNVVKAARMAEYIRRRSPRTRIILGGHVTATRSSGNTSFVDRASSAWREPQSEDTCMRGPGLRKGKNQTRPGTLRRFAMSPARMDLRDLRMHSCGCDWIR